MSVLCSAGGDTQLQQVLHSLELFQNSTFAVVQQLLHVQKEVGASIVSLKDSLIALNDSFQEQLRSLSNDLQGGDIPPTLSHELQELRLTVFRLHIDILQMKLQSSTVAENLQQQVEELSHSNRANLSSLSNSLHDLKTSTSDQHAIQQKDIIQMRKLQSEAMTEQVQLLQQFQNTSENLLYSIQELQTEGHSPTHATPMECAVPNITVPIIRETMCDVLDTHLQQKENGSSANQKVFKGIMKNLAYKISNFSEKIEELLEENSERIEAYVANVTATHQSTTDSNTSGVSSQLFCHHFIPQSCSEIAWCFPNAPPGFYDIVNSRSEKVTVYCTPQTQCCNSAGGWMRVAYLNMTDPIQECPQGFRLRMDHNKRTCGRTSRSGSCSSITYSTRGLAYRKVCGKVIAYQHSAPDAFGGGTRSIDSIYVDGISITHGQNPRQHIWTFAAALDETQASTYSCPCTRMGSLYSGLVPGYISNDYFCDTGSRGTVERGRFYYEDPLWDGEGCGPDSSCCTFNSPPWFCKHLPQPTTDHIEVRVCSNSAASYEDTPLEMIELYIQ